MSNKVTPEMFPLIINGATQWVKKSQYAKQIAEQQAIALSSDIKKAHIDQMLESLEKGVREMNPEAPEEMTKTFDRVIADYDAAIEEVARVAKEEADKKEADELEKKQKEEAEDKLVIETKDSPASFSDLSKLFDSGPNMDRFVIKGKVDDKTLLSAFRSSLSMGEFTNWMRGDLVVALEDRGQIGVVAKLCESLGQPYANIYNAAKTARMVPPEKRVKGVSYTIYAELANARYSEKEEEHKAKMAELIDKASAGGFTSSQEARLAKDIARGKVAPPAKLPEEDPKFIFIVIQEDNTTKQVCGFPKELFDKGATVVNPKTLKSFQSFRAKPENRWVALDVYTPPKVADTAKATATPAAKTGKKK